MNLNLAPEERDILIMSLAEHLSGLGMEIRNTEKRHYRQNLKDEAAVLENILTSLRTNRKLETFTHTC